MLLELVVYGVFGQSLRAAIGLYKIHGRRAEHELSHDRFFLPFICCGLFSGAITGYFCHDITLNSVAMAISLGVIIGMVLDKAGDLSDILPSLNHIDLR